MRIPSRTRLAPAILAIVAASISTGSALDRPAVDGPADVKPLLERIAAHEAKVAELTNLGSYTMTTRMEELDRKGNPSSVSEMVYRVWHKGDLYRSDVVRFVKDGEDQTAEQKKKHAERQAKEEDEFRQSKGKPEKKKEDGKSFSIGFTDPLEPGQHGKYRFTIVGRDPQNPANVRLRFEPKGEPDPDVTIGEAIVEFETGAVRRVTYHPSKNPRFVDRLDVVMEYAPGSGFESTLAKMSVDGEGGLLFYRKHIRSTTSFSEYEAPTAASPAGGSGGGAR